MSETAATCPECGGPVDEHGYRVDPLTALERAVFEMASHLVDVEEGGDIEDEGVPDAPIDAYAKLLGAVKAARAAAGREGEKS